MVIRKKASQHTDKYDKMHFFSLVFQRSYVSTLCVRRVCMCLCMAMRADCFCFDTAKILCSSLRFRHLSFLRLSYSHSFTNSRCRSFRSHSYSVYAQFLSLIVDHRRFICILDENKCVCTKAVRYTNPFGCLRPGVYMFVCVWHSYLEFCLCSAFLHTFGSMGNACTNLTRAVAFSFTNYTGLIVMAMALQLRICLRARVWLSICLRLCRDRYVSGC